MLTSALEQQREQAKITASAVSSSQRARGVDAVRRILTAHQLAAASLTFDSIGSILAEQGIEAPAEATASLTSIVTGRAADPMIEAATKRGTLGRLIAALVPDAGRTAAVVDFGRRPRLTGYVRALSGSTCPRCAILAGRWYRYNSGFQRHPRCDCIMVPSTKEIGRGLLTDPVAALREGRVHGLSKADTAAVLDHGADFGQVVNVRRKAAGLTVGSSVVVRAGRLTPQGIMSVASDRGEILALMERYGYVRNVVSAADAA